MHRGKNLQSNGNYKKKNQIEILEDKKSDV